MKVKIYPRSINEKGGIAMMPMKKNVPCGKEGWKLTACPGCGRECWETPLFALVKKQGAVRMCTECALKQALKGSVS